MDITSTIPLQHGGPIPRLGLGVFRARSGGEARQAVMWALDVGYRHIDTAAVYANERDVGAAIRASGIPREEIFVTTKLWNDDQGYERAKRALDQSLADLGLDYVDLYLVHWPVPDKRLESWRALVDLRADGKARAIGVSNFTERHLAELLQETDMVPAVNQVELSPYTAQPGLRTFCEAHGIVVEAYSPLTKGTKLGDPRLVDIAARYGKTPAQILIRWGLQKGMVVIPKSVNPFRIKENADVFGFAIADDDMTLLDGLDEDLRTGWNPLHVE